MIGLISDTGMRLAEVVGLMRKDIILNCDIPHVIIRPNEKRRLKTKQSERTVPLVGVSLKFPKTKQVHLDPFNCIIILILWNSVNMRE
jgi:integrase